MKQVSFFVEVWLSFSRPHFYTPLFSTVGDMIVP